MQDLLRLRIGDLKDDAARAADYIGVSLSDLTRMALREKVEQIQARQAAQVTRPDEAGPPATEGAA